MTQTDNPSVDTASRENDRLANDENAIDNLRAARQAGESADAWYDPHGP